MPFQPHKLTLQSQTFFRQLMARHPDWLAFCSMENESPDGFDLLVEVPSPTGDSERNLVLWVCNEDLSIAFSLWHNHGDPVEMLDGSPYEVRSLPLLDFVDRIVTDEIVCFREADGIVDAIMDLSQPDAILDVLTDKYSSGTIKIISWSGSADQQVSLADIKL